MLAEIKKIQAEPSGLHRRWFQDEYFDLFVWYQKDRSFYGFQLCYNKYAGEKAFSWYVDRGFNHENVDDGEARAGDNRTPILIPDGHFDRQTVLSRFLEESEAIDPDIVELVQEKILEYQESLEKN